MNSGWKLKTVRKCGSRKKRETKLYTLCAAFRRSSSGTSLRKVVSLWNGWPARSSKARW